MKKRIVIGWQEWVTLPEFGVTKMKAKIDTGARTSALHAFALHPFEEEGKHKIRFDIHPQQFTLDAVTTCIAEIIDIRSVTDSGGHSERRYVIQTPVSFGEESWLIEMTLAEREGMSFRMLLGRSAIRKRFRVDPAKSFTQKGLL